MSGDKWLLIDEIRPFFKSVRVTSGKGAIGLNFQRMDARGAREAGGLLLLERFQVNFDLVAV